MGRFLFLTLKIPGNLAYESKPRVNLPVRHFSGFDFAQPS